MKHKGLGWVLACCLTVFPMMGEAYNWYAPNSFETVKSTTWHYQAIYALCQEGKAPAYGAEVFSHGDMTRYELGRILENIIEGGRIEIEEDAEILEKLKKEYARELESFGKSGSVKKNAPRAEVTEKKGRLPTDTSWHIGEGSQRAQN